MHRRRCPVGVPGDLCHPRPELAPRAQLRDGSWITLKALNHEEHDVTNKVSAMRLAAR